MFNLKKSMSFLAEGKAQYLGEASPLLRPELDDDVREGDKIRVFVFETLMNAQVRQPVLKDDVPTSPDTIPNYKEINVESEGGTNYHTIIPDLGNYIQGLVLYVDEGRLARLDWWEDQYDRVKVLLGSGVHAYVYVIKVENMKDVGKNKEVELNDDDLEQIASISDTFESKVWGRILEGKRILPAGIMTFPLFGESYRIIGTERVLLNHACYVSEKNFPQKPLCSKVKLSSIVDDSTQALDEMPTCEACLSKLRKLV